MWMGEIGECGRQYPHHTWHDRETYRIIAQGRISPVNAGRHGRGGSRYGVVPTKYLALIATIICSRNGSGYYRLRTSQMSSTNG